MSALLCHKCEAQLPAKAKADLIIDVTQRAVAVKGKRVLLSQQEWLLLEALIEAGGQVATEQAIRKHVAISGMLNVAIFRLRVKIGKAAIEGVRGVGYKLACSFARGAI